MGKIQTFFKRISVVPFEAMFGFYSVYIGLAGLMSHGMTGDVFRSTIGYRWSICYNIAFVMAGSGMFFGIGFNRKDAESVGLIVVATSLVIRTIVMMAKVDTTPTIFNAYVLTIAFIIACLTRCIKLMLGRVLVETTEHSARQTTSYD